MIQLEQVTVRYGDVIPLEDVNLILHPGTTAVMGPSGSGKSSLLRILAGAQKPSSGRVSIDGSPVSVASWRSASDPRVSLIHQDYRLVPFLTVEENLRLVAELRGHQVSPSGVADALERVRLAADMRGRLPESLSGGEQQRVAIARALVARTAVILADEPTGALDEDNTHHVAQILSELGAQPGLAVVVATHDRGVAEEMDRCLHLTGRQPVPS